MSSKKSKNKDSLWDWQGKKLKIKVLFSVAGVSTQILVTSRKEENFILVDVGDGILRDVLRLPGEIYNKIDTIAITHEHFDHIGGLYSLLALFRLLDRKKKLEIVSPPQNKTLKGIIQVFKKYCKGSPPFEIELKELESGEGKKQREYQNNFITIKPFKVKHESSTIGKKETESIFAVGYTIQKENERIVYTGDTGYFPELEGIVKQADLALIESTYKDKKTKYHLSKEEAQKIGKLAKNHLLIHIPVEEYFKNIKKRD